MANKPFSFPNFSGIPSGPNVSMDRTYTKTPPKTATPAAPDPVLPGGDDLSRANGPDAEANNRTAKLYGKQSRDGYEGHNPFSSVAFLAGGQAGGGGGVGGDSSLGFLNKPKQNQAVDWDPDGVDMNAVLYGKQGF